jgi:hypothetical protein
LFATLALVAYLVQPGDTLSGIAASHGVTLAAVEAANPQLADPNQIYTGERINIPARSSVSRRSHVPNSHTARNRRDRPERTLNQPGSGESSGYSSSSLSDIPGVPQSFAACVAYRESTDLRNPAANGNAYGIMPSSGYNVYGTSLAYQKYVFAKLYRQYGGTPWAADGCPGT